MPMDNKTTHCTMSEASPKNTQRSPVMPGDNANINARPSPMRIIEIMVLACHRPQSGDFGVFCETICFDFSESI